MTKSKIEIEKMSSILKLLGDKTRLSIVFLLYQKQCCVCELVEALDMSQPAISQHLRKLRDLQLVKEDRRGQWIFYSLTKDTDHYAFIENILDYIPEQNELMDRMKEAKNNASC